jgi:hypothetical protein
VIPILYVPRCRFLLDEEESGYIGRLGREVALSLPSSTQQVEGEFSAFENLRHSNEKNELLNARQMSKTNVLNPLKSPGMRPVGRSKVLDEDKEFVEWKESAWTQYYIARGKVRTWFVLVCAVSRSPLSVSPLQVPKLTEKQWRDAREVALERRQEQAEPEASPHFAVLLKEVEERKKSNKRKKISEKQLQDKADKISVPGPKQKKRCKGKRSVLEAAAAGESGDELLLDEEEKGEAAEQEGEEDENDEDGEEQVPVQGVGEAEDEEMADLMQLDEEVCLQPRGFAARSKAAKPAG